MPTVGGERKPVRRGCKTHSDPVAVIHHVVDAAGEAALANYVIPSSTTPCPGLFINSSGDDTISASTDGCSGRGEPYATSSAIFGTHTLGTVSPDLTTMNGGGYRNQIPSSLTQGAVAMVATASSDNIVRSGSGTSGNDYDRDIDRNLILSSIATVAGVPAVATAAASPPLRPSSWPPSSSWRSWIHPTDSVSVRTTMYTPDRTAKEPEVAARPAPSSSFYSDHHSSLKVFQPGLAPSQAATTAPRVACEDPFTPAFHAPIQCYGAGAFGTFGGFGTCSAATAATAAPVVPATTTSTLQRFATEGGTGLAEPVARKSIATLKELYALEQLLFGDNSLPPAASAAISAAYFSPSGAACFDNARRRTVCGVNRTMNNIPAASYVQGAGVVGEATPAASCPWGREASPTGMDLGGGGRGGGGSLYSSPLLIGSDPWSAEPAGLPTYSV